MKDNTSEDESLESCIDSRVKVNICLHAFIMGMWVCVYIQVNLQLVWKSFCCMSGECLAGASVWF